MKKRALALLLALCIAAIHTTGAYAAAADGANSPIVAEEEAVDAEDAPETSDADEIAQEPVNELDGIVEEGSEIVNADLSSEQDTETEQAVSDEPSYGTDDEYSDEASDENTVTDDSVENESGEIYETEAIGEMIEEVQEESNDPSAEIANEDAFTEDVTAILEDVEAMEVAKSAMDQVIESTIENYDQNQAQAAVPVNKEENIGKLITYVMKNGSYSDGIYRYKTATSSTTAGSARFSYNSQIIVNLSKGFVRFGFDIFNTSNITLKTISYQMDYDTAKKEFTSIGAFCETTSYPFFTSYADIDEGTFMSEQALNFRYVAGMGFEGYEDTVKQVSNYYKDLAFLSWEKFLTEKPGLCLYSLGFKKYIFFERVKYYMSSTSFTHTGNEIVPPVSVSYFDFELEEDFHYALDYKDNKDVGIATVTVNAINGFSGSKELLFSILPAASKKVTIYNVAQGIKVTWLPVEGATRYYVYRDGEHIKTTSVLEITDGDVKYRSGEKFTYWVIATAKSVGDSIFARTGTYYRLMPVGIKKVTNSGAGKMTVTYDKSSGSSGYVVRYGLKSDMSDAKVITVKGEDTLSRTFSNLTKGKTYYVQVRTYKIDNGIRYYSGYCTTKTVKIVK